MTGNLTQSIIIIRYYSWYDSFGNRISSVEHLSPWTILLLLGLHNCLVFRLCKVLKTCHCKQGSFSTQQSAVSCYFWNTHQNITWTFHHYTFTNPVPLHIVAKFTRVKHFNDWDNMEKSSTGLIVQQRKSWKQRLWHEKSPHRNRNLKAWFMMNRDSDSSPRLLYMTQQIIPGLHVTSLTKIDSRYTKYCPMTTHQPRVIQEIRLIIASEYDIIHHVNFWLIWAI